MNRLDWLSLKSQEIGPFVFFSVNDDDDNDDDDDDGDLDDHGEN